MDHKITVNGKEYDTRDLSDQTKQLINIISAADREMGTLNAKLVTMAAGRDSLTAQLIEQVEKESAENE